MNASRIRIVKPALVFLVGLSVVLVLNVFPGSARERALERRLETSLIRLAQGGSILREWKTGAGRTVWELDTSDVIVRDRVHGYQSELDILFLLDSGGVRKEFILLQGYEGPHVNGYLKRGDLDGLTGASVTVDHIIGATDSIRADLAWSHEEMR